MLQLECSIHVFPTTQLALIKPDFRLSPILPNGVANHILLCLDLIEQHDAFRINRIRWLSETAAYLLPVVQQLFDQLAAGNVAVTEEQPRLTKHGMVSGCGTDVIQNRCRAFPAYDLNSSPFKVAEDATYFRGVYRGPHACPTRLPNCVRNVVRGTHTTYDMKTFHEWLAQRTATESEVL